MGTGVGEAALAAEAIGAAEAAGAVAGGAGLTEAALLGGEYAGGLGLTGALTEGIGSMAALGGEYGGLSSLAPAFQQATNATAVFNPETAAQVVQATNAGAIPTAGTPLGYGQVGDPALAQITQAFQNPTTSAQLAAQYGPGTQVAMAPMTATDAGAGLPGMMQNAEVAANWAKNPATLSPATAADVAQAMDAGFNPATATTEMGGNLARQTMNYVDPADMARASANAAEAAKSSFPNPFTSAYNLFMEQDKPTRYGLGALGAMQAAKYLNKPQGVAAPPGYSGPLSKFSYNPSTYTPYTYKPYAAGGPVEEMSRENAIGANTGYPQSDIQQGAYATPWQTPVSRNVVANAGDVGVDQMTGMERMARGGVARFDGGGEASGGDSGGAAAGDTGIAALGPMMYSPAMVSSSLVDPAAEYAAAQPTMNMSRQNFQDFLARYQNLPITEVAAPPVVYKDLYAGEKPGSSDAERSYVPPIGSNYQTSGMSDSWGGGGGARAGGLMHSMAMGGIANLGGYSDGGRLLKGPGDGMSDNIPATIGSKQPARLADGEFVVPADVVSGLGNGSTEAGAKQLYKMLDKVRSARTGTKKQGKQIKPEKYTPA